MCSRNPVDRIVARLGGSGRGSRARAARLLGVNAKTLEAWQRRGVIPARAQRMVIRRAGDVGVVIRAADVIPPEPDQPSGEAEHG